MEIEYTNERFPFIEQFLTRHELEVDHLQSFIPCIDQKINSRITKWTSIKLENRIVKITSRNNYKGIIRNSTDKESEKEFHIKCTPILEPARVCRQEFTQYNSHHWLPNVEINKYAHLCHKVNDIRNSAYTDTLCSIILNKLISQNYTPHFGTIYGVYSGILSDYEEDITEEYLSLKTERWFNRITNSGKYKLKTLSEKKLKSLKKDISDIEICDMDSFATEIPYSSVPMKTDIDEDAKHYLIHPKIPVQIVFMEKFDNTFDNYVKKHIDVIRETKNLLIRNIRKNNLMNRIRAWIFQICAGLSCANKNLDFVHNDLHVQNVMGFPTNNEYIYYNQGGINYKVPTYGYIMKIIDFGRSTYILNSQHYIGDVFNRDGDAGGQYTLPSSKSYRKNGVIPNPSFDLARFACSFVEDLDDDFWPTQEDLEDYGIGSLINSWTINDNGEDLMNIEGFELYINISRFFRKKTPQSQIQEEVFLKYRTQESFENNIVYQI
jgi:hypothetical protein